MKPHSLTYCAAALACMVLLGACSKSDSASQAAPTPWVRTAAIEGAQASAWVLSGTVRAKQETPLAFQMSGRVLARHVQAGQTVRAGQLLFALDPRDVASNELSVGAQVAAAESALGTAQRELERQQQLVAQGFVSAQSLDRLELNRRNAQSQFDAARAALNQVRNARSYTELRAAHDGVVTEVTGEAGQVVSAGQSLATLAQAGRREIEVFLPHPDPTPSTGVAHLSDSINLPITLGERAGAADPLSRTWRARYRLPEASDTKAWALGEVVRVTLAQPKSSGQRATQRVPLAALDERADGPKLWRVVNGQAQPVAVTVVELSATHAHITSPLNAGDKVVALGTHRLTPGMAVRELAP